MAALRLNFNVAPGAAPRPRPARAVRTRAGVPSNLGWLAPDAAAPVPSDLLAERVDVSEFVGDAVAQPSALAGTLVLGAVLVLFGFQPEWGQALIKRLRERRLEEKEAEVAALRAKLAERRAAEEDASTGARPDER